MIKIPSVNEFNRMSLFEKARFIRLETGTKAVVSNVAGFLVYEKENTLIEFETGKAGQVKEARASNLKEVIQGLIMQAIARQALAAVN
jgi:hypothetical protein